MNEEQKIIEYINDRTKDSCIATAYNNTKSLRILELKVFTLTNNINTSLIKISNVFLKIRYRM